MQHKPLPLGSRIFLVLMTVGVLWLWVSFILFRPDDERDFATVTGILVSADEHIGYGKIRTGSLEIRLQESTVRYCVPEDGYLDYFRREAFFAEVPKGATIQLTALASDIAVPRAFILNSTPTVFIRGLRVGGCDYCTLQDHIAWQKSSNWWSLGVAVAGSGFLAFIFIRLRRLRMIEREHMNTRRPIDHGNHQAQPRG